MTREPVTRESYDSPFTRPCMSSQRRVATLGSGIAFAAATPAKEIKTMISGFAIVPDRTEQPAALFTVLEDAMEWGLWTFGSDAFHIRWFDVVLVAPKEVKRPIGAA